MTYAMAPFEALGEPTRRAILELLRPGPRAVTELAAALPVSQPAVSQHLGVLRRAGLVESRRQGRRSLYRLRPEGLRPVREYVESMWGDALAAYAASWDRDPEDGEAP